MPQNEFLPINLLSEDAIEYLPCGLLILNDTRNIVLLNKELEELLGYSREELLGQTYKILLPDRLKNTPTIFDAQFEQDAASASRSHIITGRRKDGTELSLEIRLNKLNSNAGPFLLCSISDISDRRRIEHQLRVAIEAAPSGILMIDDSGAIQLVNRETERLFGYTRDELLGQSVEMLVPREYRDVHSAHRTEYAKNPAARLMGEGRDLFGLRKDGMEIPIEIGLNPVETIEGRFILCAIADISARKKAEQALHDAAEELKRSNRQLEQFAYIASHDLQEPLRVISGFMDLLSEKYKTQLDEKAGTYISYVVDAAKRMSQLITDLLKYSRVERGDREVQPVDLNKCAQIAEANLQASTQEAGAIITCDTLPKVQGNEMQLVQLFQNLLGNAIKFRRKEIPPQIHIGCHSDNSFWFLSVQDNGIGIAPEHHRRIFLIFQRLHGKKEYPGTGIGLALCEKIVEQHGGRIWVQSDVGKGSTFHFTLPK